MASFTAGRFLLKGKTFLCLHQHQKHFSNNFLKKLSFLDSKDQVKARAADRFVIKKISKFSQDINSLKNQEQFY